MNAAYKYEVSGAFRGPPCIPPVQWSCESRSEASEGCAVPLLFLRHFSGLLCITIVPCVHTSLRRGASDHVALDRCVFLL